MTDMSGRVAARRGFLLTTGQCVTTAWVVERVAAIEGSLGIYDLAQFTPR